MESRDFFVGDPAPDRSKSSHNPNFISPESHKSWIHIAPTVTSFPYNLSMPSAPYILNTEKGDFAVMKTANNIFATPISDYRKHGYFSQEYDFHMDSWIDAGTKLNPNRFDEVSLPNKDGWWSGVYVSLGEKQARFMHGDTYIRKYVTEINVIDWPNNEVGKAFSKIDNLRQALMRYYSSEEGQDFYEFLKSQGLEPDEIGYLANVSYKRAVYAVGRANDGRVIFYANDGAFEHINSAAELFGIKAEDFRTDVINEEVAHMARRSYDKSIALSDRLDEEQATKSMPRDFYLLKAKENEGTAKGRHYRKMAAIMQHDIDTTRERYTKIFRPRRESLESMVKSLTAEAREKGIDPTEYISAHLAKHATYGRKGKAYGAEKDSKYDGKNTKSRQKGKSDERKETGERAEAARADTADAEQGSGDNQDSGEGNPEAAQSADSGK